MKKKCKVFLLAIIILIFFSVNAKTFTVFALSEDVSSEYLCSVFYNNVTSSLDKSSVSAYESIFGSNFTPEIMINTSILDVLNGILNMLSLNYKEPLSILTVSVGYILICAIGSSFVRKESPLRETYDGACTIFFIILIFSSAIELIASATDVLYSLSSFMKLLVPSVVGIMAYTGTVTSSAVFSANTLFACEIIHYIASYILPGVVIIYLSAFVCMSLCTTINVDSISELIKKGINYSFSFLALIFTAVFSVKSSMSASVDRASVKGVKFMIGTGVPIVGSTVSEGIGDVLSVLNLAKNSYALFAVIMIFIVSLPILLRLILWNISLSLISSINQSFDLKSISSSVNTIKYAVSILIATIVFSVYVLILSLGLVILIWGR